MKIIKIIILALLFSCKQEVAVEERVLIPFKKDGKYGFIDQNGNVAIQPRFYNVQDFSQGLGAVRENGHYGYIDSTGKYIIQPQFDYAGSFSRGIAYVIIVLLQENNFDCLTRLTEAERIE